MHEQIGKKLSCGVILINEEKEVLMIHVTGQEFWDIPKGTKKEYESEIEAAIRELEEETSIVISESELTDMGWYEYNNYKDLWLFIAKMPEVDMSELKCSSFFSHNGMEKPEADDFSLFSLSKINEASCDSMSRLMENILTKDIEIFHRRIF